MIDEDFGWVERYRPRIGYVAFRYYVEDGIFKRKLVINKGSRWDTLMFKRVIGDRFIGDENFFIGVADDMMMNSLNRSIGKPIGELEKKMDEVKERRAEYKRIEQNRKDRWNNTKEKFEGLVIGLDRKLYTYDYGFTARVLFRSDSTFDQRKAFLKSERKNLVKWVMDELKDSKNVQKQIGNIKFYKPVELCLMRIPEVEIKFEVKNV